MEFIYLSTYVKLVSFLLKTVANLKNLCKMHMYTDQDSPYATLLANKPPNFSLPLAVRVC